MVIIYLRQTALGIDFDIFYMPFLIVTALDFLNHFSILKMFWKIRERKHRNVANTFLFLLLLLSSCENCCWPAMGHALFVLIILSYVASLLVKSFWKLLEKSVSFLGKVINITEKNDV